MMYLYVYETVYSKNKTWTYQGKSGVGFVKVGQTKRADVDVRVRRQIQGVPIEPGEHYYSILYSCEAVDKKGVIFTDTHVHNILVQRGVYNIPNTEWFACDVSTVIDAINYVKEDAKNGLIAQKNMLALVDILKQNPRGLNMRELTEKLGMDGSNILSQAKNNQIKLFRFKAWSEWHQKMVFYYRLPEENELDRELLSYEKVLSKRYARFMKNLRLTFEDVMEIIHGLTSKEAAEAISNKIGYGYSSCEKFLSNIRQPMIDLNLLVIEEENIEGHGPGVNKVYYYTKYM